MMVEQLQQLQQLHNDIQLHWFVNHIMQELPQLIETLNNCLELLSNPDSIKLPITSNNLNLLNGIIIRDGPFLKRLSINLHHFKFKYLNLVEPLELKQIKDCQLSIIDSIEILSDFIRLTQLSTVDLEENSTINSQSAAPSLNHEHYKPVNHQKFVDLFQQLLNKLQLSKQLLQLPIDPNLVFPNNIPDYTNFDPPLPNDYSLDIYINQGNISLDFKKFHIIHHEPWCKFINNKSFIDIVKDDLKLGKISVHDLNNLQDLPIYANLGLNLHSINSFNWFKKFKPIDYITKCITFNNMIVMIDKKIEVNTPDPIIISVLTKLDTLDYLISKYLDNLEILVNFNPDCVQTT